MQESDGRPDGQRQLESPRLMVELWYEKPPDLADPRLLTALRARWSETEAQQESISIPHTEVTMELEDGVMPLLTAVFAASPLTAAAEPGAQTKTLPDVSQTWDWEGAEAALARCTGSVLVSELLAQVFTPQQRVDGLMSVVQVMIEQTRPAALSWPNSQRITDPDNFDPAGLDGVVNVRFFTVGKNEGAFVMDTLGLHVFDLPDLQCHYHDFDPAAVASMLFNTALYVFDQGDVIDDGHTISGPRGDEHFVCRHEKSLIDPPRHVLDVDLGPEHVAGSRRTL
jgi:hypothetical protein